MRPLRTVKALNSFGLLKTKARKDPWETLTARMLISRWIMVGVVYCLHCYYHVPSSPTPAIAFSAALVFFRHRNFILNSFPEPISAKKHIPSPYGTVRKYLDHTIVDCQELRAWLLKPLHCHWDKLSAMPCLMIRVQAGSSHIVLMGSHADNGS